MAIYSFAPSLSLFHCLPLSLFLCVFPPFLAVHNLRKLFFFVIVSFVLFFCCCPSQDPSVVGAYCSLGHSLPCPGPVFDIVPICSHIMTHGICVCVCVDTLPAAVCEISSIVIASCSLSMTMAKAPQRIVAQCEENLIIGSPANWLCRSLSVYFPTISSICSLYRTDERNARRC